MQWFGKPVNFNRFLGQVDQDDPTNLPVGLAAICRNTDFTRDSPGVTCASTRAGINLAWQLVGANSQPSFYPVTGAVYFRFSPELITQFFFEMPFAFDYNGNLQRESPSGTGKSVLLPASSTFTAPVQSHMLATAAFNKVWAAFSNLKTATGPAASIDPNAIQTGVPIANAIPAVNQLGMKQVGWYWQPNTAILVGEVCCPTAPVNGNGHTYRALNSGITAATQAAQPVWPLTENGTVTDNPGPNQVVWEEYTMVMANRLPPPAVPVLVPVASGGTFAAGLDIYALLTVVNDQGESLPGLPAIRVNSNANDAIQLTMPTLASMAGWIRSLAPAYTPTGFHIYIAAVPTGAMAPSSSSYQQVSGATSALGAVVTVTAVPTTAVAPPTQSLARVTPGQLPTPDTEVVIQRIPLVGNFPAGRDVYVAQTYTNAIGETKLGPVNLIVDTVLDDAIQATVAVPEDSNGNALYNITQVGIYEADVATGTPAPAPSEFALVGYYAVGATPTITSSAGGPNPPTANTTGPAGNIAADTATGGNNGTQGYRYAALLFMNGNTSVSGFTPASVISYIVDLDGYEIGVFNITPGPAYVAARLCAFTGADSTQDGPFDWIGNVNLLVPTQNQVYPEQMLVDAVEQSATAIFDNTTTQAIFNFTDDYLAQSNNVDDRTDLLAPFQPCRIDYLKTIASLAFSGVNGYTGGVLVSVADDPESVYADVGAVPFPSDGQRCYGATDAYKSVIFILREKSGYAIQSNTGNPATWQPIQRWADVGPCGFKAWAANGKFIFFVDPTGAYKYDESDPDLMSKEIPREWATINWEAKEQITVTIDEDTHTVRIQVPTGQSTVNNKEFCLSYLEGWQNPIHFSTFSGKEISMDACRRWSFNDIQANVCVRMDRTLKSAQPAYIDGPNWETQPGSSDRISQLLYGSSGYDGGIHARSPGVYSDNGAGIDWVYRTVCAGLMQAMCKPEGFNLNADGQGLISAAFIASRLRSDGAGGTRNTNLPMRDFALDPSQKIGITRKCPPRVNEFWSVEFTNRKQPGAWCSLKQMTAYMIPVSGGRDPGDKQ